MAAAHQHYVPQLLLRGFLSQIGDEGKKEQIRVFDLENKERFSTSIANIMGERRFNDWWIDENTIASIEPATSQIESELAPLIEKIRSDKRLTINPDNISNLALLMAFQFIRTKKMRLIPERMNEKLVTQIRRMGLDPTKVDGLAEWDKDSLKRQHVNHQIKALSKYTKIMSDKIFFVMTAPEGKNFYLSDHPVCLHIDEEKPGFLKGLGIGVPYIQIYLPLASNVMLCAYDSAVLGGLMRVRDETMNKGKGDALKLLIEGRITAQQMKGFVEEAKQYDEIGPLIEKIRSGEPVAASGDQVDAYNSLQVFHAHRFVVDPAGKFNVVDEMIAEREASDKRERDGTA